VEGEWRWLDDELFWLGNYDGGAQNGAFTAWYPTAPYVSQADARDCLVIDTSQATVNWYNIQCGSLLAFACESP
jgi:hypothetical protein